ncbi:MAG: S8 family serine peptidase, partial [Cyanobacteria bacterium]|nr:S8 family serine peptidase [Cyanobacteriota bacterium]
IRALGNIGNATNPNSYTRSTLNQELTQAYQNSKEAIKTQIGLKKPPETLKGIVSQSDERQDHLAALTEAAISLGKLNVESGRNMIIQEYKTSLEGSENNNYAMDEIRRAVQLAKEDFIRSLEEQFQKPIEEILSNLSPSEVRKLNTGIMVTLPGGQQIGVRQAEDVLRRLEVQQKFSAHLMMGLVEGLAQQNDSQINNIIKQGLGSFHPQVKAKSLSVLGNRNELNYASDIYPNLTNSDKNVRKAALMGLLHSNDPSARQTMMDYLKPARFFATLGVDPKPETVPLFSQFLSHLAQNGEKYIGPLAKVATNQDFDLERRALALLCIQKMTQMPFRKNTSAQALGQAEMVIQSVAMRPAGKSREERDEISLFATSLWAGLKDPRAIVAAIKLSDDRFRELTPKDQENLLESVFTAIQTDYDNVRRDEPEPEQFLSKLLWVFNKADKTGENAFITPELLQGLEKQIKPTAGNSLFQASLEEISKSMVSVDPAQVKESEFVQEVRGQLPILQPILKKLLKHEKSIPIRILAARILGLMHAKEMVPQLMEQTRSPLGGLVDWKKEKSFEGVPTGDGAKMRLNNILALGEIGDPKAAEIMIDALDDPALRRYIFTPLNRLASAVNQTGDEVLLKKIHTKLNTILANPNNTRLQRAIRMNAADSLFQFNGGKEALKTLIEGQANPEFKRHLASAFLKNDYALTPDHPDHGLVKPLLTQGSNIETLHQEGLSGKGVEIAIVDGGYIDHANAEAFQKRVRIPAKAGKPKHPHPSMVMSTAAANGAIKGVAPDAIAYSEMWPEFNASDPMDVYKKMIEGKFRGENNLRVINNSWGFTDNNILIHKEVRQILKEFKNIVNLAERAGILFVFAAGNEGEEGGIPGVGTLSLFGIDIDKLTAEENKDYNDILDKVVLVGAVNPAGSTDVLKHRVADFSSIGDSLNRRILPTVLAPGVDMSVYGYENGNRSKSLVNGTSFAAPFVTGVSALLWEKNPSLTPAQVREILKTTAIKLPDVPDTFQGAGEIDPVAAVQKAESLLEPQKKKIAKKPTPTIQPIKQEAETAVTPITQPPIQETPGTNPSIPENSVPGVPSEPDKSRDPVPAYY